MFTVCEVKGPQYLRENLWYSINFHFCKLQALIGSFVVASEEREGGMDTSEVSACLPCNVYGLKELYAWKETIYFAKIYDSLICQVASIKDVCKVSF